MTEEKLMSNISILKKELSKKEETLRQQANFCSDHNFKKEEEWLRMKVRIIQEIRFEVDLLTSDNEYRPFFDF